jgi:hypothetical protein
MEHDCWLLCLLLRGPPVVPMGVRAGAWGGGEGSCGLCGACSVDASDHAAAACQVAQLTVVYCGMRAGRGYLIAVGMLPGGV